VLARIWCKVLGLKHVGIHDNFFESGGHSLADLRIFSKIEKEFGDRPPVGYVIPGADNRKPCQSEA
jgi:hypothetical protein